ncbi:PH domain-containing protein [Streptomyces sp. NPDC000410]|uniref:PH domain-containing protein n=1 Tax=Streptomyces sp. NPDC000410 TaxID=3154254 RepID=UPI0033173357
MTTPTPDPEPTYADRVFRSPAGLVAGVLLLALVAWLGGDALFRGEGRARAMGLALLLLGVPLIVAFTLRPAVFAGEDRLRIRNPFRTITLPWAAVKTLSAIYSVEVFTQQDAKYQMWAVPVSLRARKRASARQALAGDDASRGADVRRAPADQTVAELRELAERGASRPGAQGEPQVRWAYEIIAPAAVGAVVVAVLLATG